MQLFLHIWRRDNRKTIEKQTKAEFGAVEGKETCVTTSHFQLEASSIAMRQNMLHDQLVRPAVMTQTAVKRRLLATKPPKKLFPSEIFLNFSELSSCYSVC